MNTQTIFGFTLAWWTAQDTVSKKANAPARIVYGARLVALAAVALWA